MYLIDTNVVSEFLKPDPAPAVMLWFTTIRPRHLFISSVTEAELRMGAAILPSGKRRDMLAATIETVVGTDFAGRILNFDSPAAEAYALIAARRRSFGRPIASLDCMIAAIAFSRQMTLVTRNRRDFEGSGVELIDPWLAG